MPNTLTSITAEDLEWSDVMLAPPRKGKTLVPMHELIVEEFELTSEHMGVLGEHMEGEHVIGAEVTYRPLQALRRQHHRLAQFLAMGMSVDRAAVMCDYAPGRVYQLTGDPAFQALLAHYSANVEEAHRSFVQEAADLNEDMVLHLRDILETSPERITPQIALEAIKTLADRTGNAPTSKNLNINVTAGFGDRLKAARERSARLYVTSVTDVE